MAPPGEYDWPNPPVRGGVAAKLPTVYLPFARRPSPCCLATLDADGGAVSAAAAAAARSRIRSTFDGRRPGPGPARAARSRPVWAGKGHQGPSVPVAAASEMMNNARRLSVMGSCYRL